MASLFAPRRQDPAAAFGLHARAKAVRFVAAAHLRLKRAFRQRTLPSASKIGADQKVSVVEGTKGVKTS